MADDYARDDELAEIPDAAARAQARRVIDEMRTRLHAVHAPPDFHARGMARIRQLPPPQGGLARWWTGVSSLAGALRGLGPGPSYGAGGVAYPQYLVGHASPETAPTRRPYGCRAAAGGAQCGWDHGRPISFRCRCSMLRRSGRSSRPVLSPRLPAAMVGFTPHAARPTFVRMGILYADTLAALQSGAVEAAKHRLDVLTQALVTSLQAPPVLSQYLREMQAMPAPAACG